MTADEIIEAKAREIRRLHGVCAGYRDDIEKEKERTQRVIDLMAELLGELDWLVKELRKGADEANRKAAATENDKWLEGARRQAALTRSSLADELEDRYNAFSDDLKELGGEDE